MEDKLHKEHCLEVSAELFDVHFLTQLTSMLFSSTKQKPREVLVTLSLINLMSFKLSAHTLVTACLTYRKLPEKKFSLWPVSCTNFSLHTQKVATFSDLCPALFVVIQFSYICHVKDKFSAHKVSLHKYWFYNTSIVYLLVYQSPYCMHSIALLQCPQIYPIREIMHIITHAAHKIKSLVYHKYVCKGDTQN